MSPSKMPSAMSRAGRGRSMPYAIGGNPRSKPSALPMTLGLAPGAKKPLVPGQSTTCIAYAFQPAQGQEAILLIPTTALKFEFREMGGQKVLQFLPPSATFVPLVKATAKPPAASTQGQQEQGTLPAAPKQPPQQTTTSSASSAPTPATKDKSSVHPSLASSVATVVKPTFRFPERPESWNNALRLDYGGKIYTGKKSTAAEQDAGVGGNKMAPAKAFPGQEEIDEEKRKAYFRHGMNNKLISQILDERVVDDVIDESTWREIDSTSKKERISSLASKVRSVMADVERTEIQISQKMAEVAEDNDLFRYKLIRFQQLAALITSDEFHRATVEAELEQYYMQSLDIEGSTCAL